MSTRLALELSKTNFWHLTCLVWLKMRGNCVYFHRLSFKNERKLHAVAVKVITIITHRKSNQPFCLSKYDTWWVLVLLIFLFSRCLKQSKEWDCFRIHFLGMKKEEKGKKKKAGEKNVLDLILYTSVDNMWFSYSVHSSLSLRLCACVCVCAAVLKHTHTEQSVCETLVR